MPLSPHFVRRRVKCCTRGQRTVETQYITCRPFLKIVTHARYVTFQMAEVAVPSQLFAEILRLIDGLRPPPTPA